jgi:hypothetical protein
MNDKAKQRKYELRKRNRQRSRLFEKIQQYQDDILTLADHASGMVYEDRMYRFYHASLKVFWMQDEIEDTMKLFKKLSPSRPYSFDKWFLQIIEDAKSQGLFKREYNKDFPSHARPVVEAYLHCKYFLEMLAESTKLKEDPMVSCKEGRIFGIPSGYAAILELYNLRY